MSIRTLPIDVIHTIAAGEVIDSLAAVVRELCENALDAGATRITVSLLLDRWQVRVADNGNGIELADLHQAATAHSTSKIGDRADLFQINSLGFRGEALHSLAQLAKLEIYSRPRHSSDGWHLVYNHRGEVVHHQEVAIATGTVICVEDIFGDWAARRDGLPTIHCQLRQVQMVIHHLALCHPHVSWTVEQDRRPWFEIVASRTVQQLLPQLIAKVRAEDFQYLSLDIAAPDGVQPAQIQVTLGLPDRCHRHRLDWVKVAVNGRIVRMSELEQTIVSSLLKTLPRDRYPICFVHLRVPPRYIDWNRHPAKVEIYLQQIAHWQSQLTHALDRALNFQPEQLSEDVRTSRIAKLLTVAEQQGNYHTRQLPQPLPEVTASADGDGLGLLELRAVGQVLNTYIIAEHPQGLWLVEQHIAHERVLFEQLSAAWQFLPLEPPLLLTHLSEQQIERLQAIGTIVDAFGEGLWAIRNAPEPLLLREDLAAAMTELSLGADLQTAQVAVACRCAIRNGTPLSIADMQSLLDRWQRTRNPRTCPHGRPIYLSFKETSLARSFRRHWVIGKSHGI